MGDSALFLCKNIVHVLLNDKLHVNIVNILKYMYMYMHNILSCKCSCRQNLPALQVSQVPSWDTIPSRRKTKTYYSSTVITPTTNLLLMDYVITLT